MKGRSIFGLAILLAAAVSAIACDDVYETNLVPSQRGPEPAPQDPAPPRPTALPSRTLPVLCAAAMEEGMADAGLEAGCESPGAVCEYGSSPDRACNDVYSCSASGIEPWQKLPSELCAASQCPQNLPIAALENTPCAMDGGGDADEVLCPMSDGTCACTTGRGGTDVHERRWTCAKPLSACPLARPKIGQPCRDGLLCDYGSCQSKRGMAMICLSGVWAATSIDCE